MMIIHSGHGVKGDAQHGVGGGIQPQGNWLRGITIRALVSLILAGVFSAAGSAVTPVGADTNALTDDSSVGVPTSAYVYTGVSEATISSLNTSLGTRISDIEVYDAAANTFTVSLVRNSGAYAVPGWWWYYDQSFAQVGERLQANSARLVDIEAYSDGGVIKFATVMVSNTGTAARGWSYLAGVSVSQISSHITANNQRMIDVEAYTEGTVKKYAAVFVTNSGSDAKAWEWWIDHTPAEVTSRVNAFGGRVVDLERQADGTYVFIQVKNAGTDGFYWRYHFGLTITQVTQVLSQYGVRAVDIDTYTSGRSRLYDLVAIDNLAIESRRLSNIIAPTLTSSNGLPNAAYGFFLKPLGTTKASAALQQTKNFEPASAVKAVHNLAIMRKVKDGQDSLSANNFAYYNYSTSQSIPGNACPDPAEETAANRVLTTVQNAQSMMMGASDNRTTRGVVLRYGFPYVQQAATFAGMTKASIQQDRVGCGFVNDKRNQVSLVDFGKLYEGVENGSLLGTGSLRTSFFSPMNGQAITTDGGSLENRVIEIVKAEAAAQGKSGVVTAFVQNMNWQFKPGGYGIACGSSIYANCSAGFYSVGTLAGVVRIPFKVSTGAVAGKAYVFGTYVDGLNTGCSGCPTYPSGTEEMLRAELLRSQIRAALRTW
ncbi:MAG: serine hydrolase [Actinomycetota bacterium]|nr:serine hydrolase [Actinomycetota bacterium]